MSTEIWLSDAVSTPILPQITMTCGRIGEIGILKVMDARIDPAHEVFTVDDVVAAGAARAKRGGREVVLPGGMGVALIEELEQEVAREAVSAAEAISEPTPVDDFTARIDAARERLREQTAPVDDSGS